MIENTNPQMPVIEALEKLAAQGTADQIALFLQEQGIQGRPSDSTSCLVAQYLKKTTDLQQVDVMFEDHEDERGSTVVTGLKICEPTVTTYTPSTGVITRELGERLATVSGEVMNLALKFDHGDYPELEVKPV